MRRIILTGSLAFLLGAFAFGLSTHAQGALPACTPQLVPGLTCDPNAKVLPVCGIADVLNGNQSKGLCAVAAPAIPVRADCTAVQVLTQQCALPPAPPPAIPQMTCSLVNGHVQCVPVGTTPPVVPPVVTPPVVVVKPPVQFVTPGSSRIQITDGYGRGEGPTWTEANNLLHTHWAVPGGDWVDAAGIARGHTPFATIPQPKVRSSWVKAEGPGMVALVEKLRADNTGFFLHTTIQDVDPAKFITQNHATLGAYHPTLKVVTDQGTFDVPLVADTWIPPSALYPQVTAGDMGLPGIVKFDLSQVKGKVLSASLALYYTAYGAQNIAVDFLDAPELLTLPAKQHPERVELGIARNGEAALRTHPSVLVYANSKADFDREFQVGWYRGDEWKPDTGWVTDPDSGLPVLRIANTPAGGVNSPATGKWIPFSTTAVNLEIALLKNPGNRNQLALQRDWGKPWEHLFLRYTFRLENDTMARLDAPGTTGPYAGRYAAYQEAKIPALSGNFANLNSGARADWGINDNWGMSLEQGLPSPSHGDAMPFASYTYDMDNVMTSNDRGRWVPTGAAFIRGHTYTIEQEVQMNTPGKNDGVLRLWLDGVQVYELTTIRYRNRPEGGIFNAIMLYMNGGNGAPYALQHLQIGGWTIATEYIGPPKH